MENRGILEIHVWICYADQGYKDTHSDTEGLGETFSLWLLTLFCVVTNGDLHTQNNY